MPSDYKFVNDIGSNSLFILENSGKFKTNGGMSSNVINISDTYNVTNSLGIAKNMKNTASFTVKDGMNVSNNMNTSSISFLHKEDNSLLGLTYNKTINKFTYRPSVNELIELPVYNTKLTDVDIITSVSNEIIQKDVAIFTYNSNSNYTFRINTDLVTKHVTYHNYGSNRSKFIKTNTGTVILNKYNNELSFFVNPSSGGIIDVKNNSYGHIPFYVTNIKSENMIIQNNMKLVNATLNSEESNIYGVKSDVLFTADYIGVYYSANVRFTEHEITDGSSLTLKRDNRLINYNINNAIISSNKTHTVLGCPYMEGNRGNVTLINNSTLSKRYYNVPSPFYMNDSIYLDENTNEILFTTKTGNVIGYSISSDDSNLSTTSLDIPKPVSLVGSNLNNTIIDDEFIIFFEPYNVGSNIHTYERSSGNIYVTPGGSPIVASNITHTILSKDYSTLLVMDNSNIVVYKNKINFNSNISNPNIFTVPTHSKANIFNSVTIHNHSNVLLNTTHDITYISDNKYKINDISFSDSNPGIQTDITLQTSRASSDNSRMWFIDNIISFSSGKYMSTNRNGTSIFAVDISGKTNNYVKSDGDWNSWRLINTVTPKKHNFTFTVLSNVLYFNSSSHGLLNGDKIKLHGLSEKGFISTPVLNENTEYTVVLNTDDTFSLSGVTVNFIKESKVYQYYRVDTPVSMISNDNNNFVSMCYEKQIDIIV